MKHWINSNYRTIIVIAFIIPIVVVAVVSISHVTQWYGIANPLSWAIYLSFGIEIAAMSALAAISVNLSKHVYLPFIIVTFIQFIGNIFFSYDYIKFTDHYFIAWVELVSPIFQFTGIEPTDLVGHKRILALFAGGTLPVISLSFLHLLVRFTEEQRLKELADEEKSNEPKPIDDKPVDVVDVQDLASEFSRARLTDEQLEQLSIYLSKKPPIEKSAILAPEVIESDKSVTESDKSVTESDKSVKSVTESDKTFNLEDEKEEHFIPTTFYEDEGEDPIVKEQSDIEEAKKKF
jgi:hypothetical protein